MISESCTPATTGLVQLLAHHTRVLSLPTNATAGNSPTLLSDLSVTRSVSLPPHQGLSLSMLWQQITIDHSRATLYFPSLKLSQCSSRPFTDFMQVLERVLAAADRATQWVQQMSLESAKELLASSCLSCVSAACLSPSATSSCLASCLPRWPQA